MEKKKIFLILFLAVSLVSFAYSSIRVNVNNRSFTGKIDGDIVFLDLEEICSAFQIKFGYFPDTGIVAINYNDSMISTVINQRELLINSNYSELENPPRIIDKKVYFPVNFFIKHMGFDISWTPEDFEENTIISKIIFKETNTGLDIFVLADKPISKNEYVLNRKNKTLAFTFPDTKILFKKQDIPASIYISDMDVNNFDSKKALLVLTFTEKYDISVGPVVEPKGFVIRVVDANKSVLPENQVIDEEILNKEFVSESTSENTQEEIKTVGEVDESNFQPIDNTEIQNYEDTAENNTENVDMVEVDTDTEENIYDLSMMDSDEVMDSSENILNTGLDILNKDVSLSLSGNIISENKESINQPEESYIENVDDLILEQDAMFTDTLENYIKDKKIVIDPGHGGSDKGIIKFGVYEKDINLAISKKIYSKINGREGTAYLTRSGNQNIDFEKRSYVVNRNKADLMISIHCGASLNDNVSGFSIFYYSNPDLEGKKEAVKKVNIENERKAQEVLMELKKITIKEESRKLSRIFSKYFSDDLGFAERNLMYGNFSILKDVNCPAVIIEINNLTNREAADMLKDDAVQEKISEVIVKVIDSYFSKGDYR